ncbi:CRAL-TRIO domain-containing protein, partial [Mrakia frigida]|uniref:SEC14 family lipid-binding protein n=1 Tax=Mrakia frigida TaxID=29902 RepID=UPI003FCBF23E
MSRRSSVVIAEDLHHTRSLSRSSSVASSHLSRWSKPTTTTPTGSRRGSLESHEDGGAARNPLSGHVGHLTPEQEVKLNEFKEELSKRHVYSEGGNREEGGGKGRGRVDDSTLLRFLRARKFNVEGAVKQYTDFLAWRDDKGVDQAYENYDIEEFETLRRAYPMWTGSRDLRGLPIYVYKISALTPATLSRLIPNDAASSSSIAVITFALIRFLLPFTTAIQRPDQPMSVISGSNSIIDVGGVGLSRFWGLRSHLQVASQVASANFPETIDRVFVVGAPSFFPTVFNWAKKWFDPGTVEKIHILSNDSLPTLLTMMPKESIPKEYGGELDWTYGQDPNLDEDAKKALGG